MLKNAKPGMKGVNICEKYLDPMADKLSLIPGRVLWLFAESAQG